MKSKLRGLKRKRSKYDQVWETMLDLLEEMLRVDRTKRLQNGAEVVASCQRSLEDQAE